MTGRPTCLKFVSATPYMILWSRFNVILLAMSTMDLRFNRVFINGTCGIISAILSSSVLFEVIQVAFPASTAFPVTNLI